MEVKFIADVHLGKLARLLRMLGFDTVYKNDFTLNELVKISDEENRILLSRNASLLKIHADKCFIVSDEDPPVQLKQVIQHFGLKDQSQPFSRCIVCNGILESVSKESIAYLLQKNTASYFNEFWQCKDCGRIYWKGSHYERMLKTIRSVIS
ncbi:MAG TPA: Mut7-C RNAse domain-containing protein [Flavisolibacter sp.]|nr:Mut7-C RNAse domain-containing protein [Flavisolibacter sp.]